MLTSLPTSVRIVEVGPRDGLQNEESIVSVENKIELIERLTVAGLKMVEIASFVSPRWVPQMADSARVLSSIRRNNKTIYSALVPNIKGLEAALSAGAEEIAIFGSASETFSQKNINCSIAESLIRFKPILKTACNQGIPVRGYVSCALGCPYEGEIKPTVVSALAQSLIEMGCYEVSLGDTNGVGTPGKTKSLLEEVARRIPVRRIAGHYHDTYGQAIANIYASLEVGISTFDSSVAGLGGCPYAKGATGNVATEDVVYLMHGLGIETGIDLNQLIDAGTFISHILGRPTKSKVAQAVMVERKNENDG